MALENIAGGATTQAPLIGLKGVDPFSGLDQGDTKNVPLIGLRGDQNLMRTQEGQTPGSYNRILDGNYHPEFMPQTIQRQLATNQTGGEQLINTLAGATMGEIGGGLLKDIGYLMGGPSMLSKTAEDSFGKSFIDAGTAIQEKSNELFPIYRDPQAPKFDPSSWSWWLQNAKGMASILPVVALAYTGVGAIGAVGEAAGIASSLGLGAVEQAGVSAVGKALINRHIFNMMFAHSTYEDLYNKSVQLGMSTTDADKKAAIGAADSYKKDWALLPLDVLQYGLVTKALLDQKAPVSYAFSKLMGSKTVEAATKVAPNALQVLGKEVAIGGGQLGFQWMMSEEGKYTAEKAFDPSLKSDFTDRVGKYLGNGDFWSSAVIGGMGGAVFTGVGNALGRMFKGDPQVNEAKAWASSMSDAAERSKVAEERGDPFMASEAKRDHEIQLGTRAAQNGLLDQSIDFFRKVAKGEFTPDEGKQLGLTPEEMESLKAVRPEDIENSVKNIREAGEKYQERLKDSLTDGTDLNKSLNKLYEERTDDMKKYNIGDYARMYASLVSQTETKLNRLNESRIQVESDLENTKNNIVNWSSLSTNKQQQWLEESHLSALEAQKVIVDATYNQVREDPTFDDSFKKDLKFQHDTVNQLVKKHQTALDGLKKTYSPEEEENDKGIDITSDSMHDYLDKDYDHAGLLIKIASYQSASDRYRKGQISTKEAKDSYNQDLKDAEDDVRDVKPEQGDVVGWTDEDTGQRHAGVVHSIDDNYNVQEIGPDFNDIGQPIPKNPEDLELLNKWSDVPVNTTEVEPISDSDIKDPSTLEQESMERDGTNKALADNNSLSTSHRGADGRTIVYRDVDLYNYSNNPDNKFEGGVASYSIDWDNQFWSTHEAAKLALQKGETIDELLSTEKDPYLFNHLVDKIPIKVSIGVKDQTFNKGLYMHDSDFWNVRKPAGVMEDPEVFVKNWREGLRQQRRDIISQILQGKEVTTKDLKKLSGHFNTVKTNGNVHERFNIKPGEFKVYIGTEGLLGTMMATASSTDTSIAEGLSRGGVYMRINKTANGEYRYVKLNPGKLSAEHAGILLDSIILKEVRGGGRKAILKDKRVEGLNVNETISLLALLGDKSTNPDHVNNKDKSLDVNKQLWVDYSQPGRKILHYGTNALDILETSQDQAARDKADFINWATTNKNYRIPIDNKSIGLSLNEVYKKKFKIGSFTNDPKDNKTYAATLMDTKVGEEPDGTPKYILSTNLDRVKDTTTGKYVESLTHSPVIDINTRSLDVKERPKVEESTVPQEPVKPGEPVVVQPTKKLSLKDIKPMGWAGKDVFNPKGYPEPAFDETGANMPRFTKPEVPEEKIGYEIQGTNIPTITSWPDLEDVTKALTHTLIKENKIQSINDIIQVGDQFFKPLLDFISHEPKEGDNGGMIQQFKAVAETSNDPTEIEQATKLKELYESVINPKYLPIFVNRINTELREWNIAKRVENKEVDDNTNINENSEPNLFLQYLNKAPYELNIKDTINAAVKFLIKTLPESEEINPRTYTTKFVDFNSTFSNLIRDLHNVDTVDEMLQILDSKSDKVSYKALADRLRAGDDLLRIQFKVAMNKQRNNFVNFLFNLGPDGRPTYEMSDASMQAAINGEIANWNQTVYESNLINKTDKPVLDVEKIGAIQQEYNTFAVVFSRDYEKSGRSLTDQDIDKYITNFIPMANRIGMDVDRETIDEVVNKIGSENALTKSEALNNFFLQDFTRIIKGLSTSKSIRRLFSDEKIIRDIARSKYETKPELLSDSILGPGGNKYFTYSQNTYLSDTMRGFAKDANTIVDKISKVYNRHSDFLNQMTDNKVRQNVGILTNSSLIQKEIGDSGRDYLSINRIEDYVTKMYAFERGLIPLPTMGDRRSYYYLTGLKAIDFDLPEYVDGKVVMPQNVIDLFYNYAKDEEERIAAADKVIKAYKAETDPAIKADMLKKMYLNYHYVKRGNNPPDFGQANALRHLLFPEFDKVDNFDFERDSKDIIHKVLLDRLNDELLIAKDKGLIDGAVVDGLFRPHTNVKLDAGTFDKNLKDQGTERKALENMMARYMIRTMQSSIEYGKLFAGDPAFKKWNPDKKNIDDDYVKRLNSGLSTGDVTNNSSAQYNVDATNYTAATMYTQEVALPKLVYEDIFNAQLNELVKEYSKKSGYEDLPNKKPNEQVGILKKDFGINLVDMLKGYNDIDSTDGQAYISPAMYRSLSVSIGEWSPEKEDAFNLLQADRELTSEEYTKSLNVALQPLKVLSYGLMADGDIEVPILNKMSVATLFRQMGRFGHGEGKRIELMNLLDRMEGKGKYEGLKPIDMVKMNTAVKSGGKVGFNFYSDPNLEQVSDFKDIPTFEEPYNLTRKQLNTDPHDQEDIKVTTQAIKIGMSNLQLNDAIYDNPRSAGNKKLTGSELAEHITKSVGGLSGKGLERFETNLGFKNGVVDKPSLIKILKNNAEKSGSPDLIVDALKMDPDGTRMYLELDALPNRKQVMSGLISRARKDTADINTPGGQMTQFSNMGIRVNKNDELKFTTATEHGVNSMECYVSLNLFKHLIPNFDKLSYEEKRAFVLKNKDDIMGYRVPAQGQGSVWTLKVKDVYPETIGDVITLPAAFTRLTGSDFDIDKAYVIRHNYNIIDGKARKIGFHETPQEVWDKEMAPKYEWAQRAMDRLDKIKNNDFGPAGGKIETEDLLNSLNTILTPEMVDGDTKENTLQSMLANLFNDKFVDEEYDKLKSVIGKMEDKKKAYFDKYGEETDPYKFNSEEAIQNTLMDSYKSILSNLAHVVATTTPLGSFDKMINDLADEVHKNDEQKYSSKDLVLHTPSKQSDIKFEHTGGKAGMAPFALNNVHHVLSQLAGLKLRREFNTVPGGILNQDAEGNLDLSQINGKDNYPISSWISSLINVHIDAAKDPRFMWLNINPTTWDAIGLMIRGGYGLDTFRLTSQPIIKEYSELMLDSGTEGKITRFPDRRAVVTELRRKWVDKKLTKDVTIYDPASLLTTVELTKHIENKGSDVSAQLQYLDTFLDIMKTGKKLNGLVQASQLDANKVSNTIIGLQDSLDKVDKIIADNEFIGLDKMFGPGSFLYPYYTNYLKGTLNVLQDLSIYSTPVFTEMFREMKRLTHTNYVTDTRLAENMADELAGTVYAKFFNDPDNVGLNPKKIEEVFKNVTKILSDIKGNPKYKDLLDNPLIKMLNKAPIETSDGLPFDSFLTIPNKSLTDKGSSDAIMYAWRDLFRYDDKKVQNLARLLLYYSYATSGFRNRMFSFHNYIPPDIMKSFEGIDPSDPTKTKSFSFNDFIKNTRDLMGDPSNRAMFSNLIDEAIINNWSNSRIQPIIPRTSVGHEVREDGDVKAIVNYKYGSYLGKNELDQPVFIKYQTAMIDNKRQELQYIGYVTDVVRGKETDVPVYKIISKRSYEKGGVVVKEMLFDKSIVDTNNVKSIPDGDEVSLLKSKENLNINPVYGSFEPVLDLRTVQPKLEVTKDIVEDDGIEDIPVSTVPEPPKINDLSEGSTEELPKPSLKTISEVHYTSEDVIHTITRDAKTVKDVEDTLLGYKTIINSKRHLNQVWVKADDHVNPFHNHDLAEYMANQVNEVIPGLIDIHPEDNLSHEKGRGIWTVRVDPTAWQRWLDHRGDKDYEQGSLFKRVGEQFAKEREDIQTIFDKSVDINDAHAYINNLKEIVPDMSEDHKTLIGLLDNIPNKADLPIESISTYRTSQVLPPVNGGWDYYDDALAVFGPNKDPKSKPSITLFKDKLIKETKSMLVGATLHEMIHGYTLDAYNKVVTSDSRVTKEQSEFIDTVRDIFIKAKRLTKYVDENAYKKGLKEFIADGPTDQKIIDELKTMYDPIKKLTFWQKFKGAILRLFGLDPTPKSYHEQLLSAIMDYVYKVRKPNTGVQNIQALKIRDNIRPAEENPDRVKIVDSLIKSEDSYDEIGRRYENLQPMMDRLAVGGLPYELYDERTKGNMNRYFGADLGTKAQLERSFHTVGEHIENKYHLSPQARADLDNYFASIKRPGMTMLSNVTLVDWKENMANKADLVTIHKGDDGKEEVHIFKFKSREQGFKEYDNDQAIGKRGEKAFTKYSDFKRDQIEMTIMGNMFKDITNTDVRGLHIIPLKPILNDVTKTIDRYVLDRSFNDKDVIDMPTTINAALLYINKAKSMNPEDHQDIATPEEMDLIKDTAEKFRLKMEKMGTKTPEQKVVMDVIKSLEKQMAISQKTDKTHKSFRAQMEYINKLVREDDTQKQIKYVVDQAEQIVNRSANELKKLKDSGEPIKIGQLYRYKDAVSAFNVLEDYESLLTSRFGLTTPTSLKETNPAEYERVVGLRRQLSDIVKLKNSVQEDYKNYGLETLAEHIFPYYTKVEAEFKHTYAREYDTYKYDKEHSIVKQRKGQSDDEYESYKREVESFNPELTRDEYINTKSDAEGNTIKERTKLVIRKELKKAAQDESALLRWIGNILDTRDAVTNALIKSFVVGDESSRIEIENHRLRSLPIVDEFMKSTDQYGHNFGKRYEFMRERDPRTGELTGNIVTKFPSKLIEEYRNVRAVADATIEDEDTRRMFVYNWKEINMPEDKEARREAYIGHLDRLRREEIITQAEFDRLEYEARKTGKKSLISDIKKEENSPITDNTEDLLIQWFNDNSLTFREPSKEWRNPQWDALQKILKDPNDPRTKMYNLITEWQQLADSMVPSSVKLGTRVPGLIKDKMERLASGQNLGEFVKGSLSKAVTFKVDDTHRVQTDLVDNDRNARYFIPTHYTGKVTKTVKDAMGNEYQVFDPDEQSWNLVDNYFHYLGSAIDFQWKNNIMPDMEMARYLLDNRDVTVRDSKGIKYAKSKFFGEETEDNEQVIKGGNISKQYGDWLLYALYGQGQKDLGTIPGTNIDAGKLVNILQRFTAINLLGLNYMAGANSAILTETIMAIDAFAYREIGRHEWKVAQGTFFKNLPGIMGDIGSKQPTNLVSLLLKEFNVSHAGKFNNLTDTKMRDLAKSNAMFFVATFGWWTMQAKTMLGLLERKHAFNSKGEDIGSILSHYKVVDGKLTLDKEVDEGKSQWTERDRRLYEHKMNGVISGIHGDQSSLAHVALQNSAIGGLALMFRRFVVPTFLRRWGSEYYNERTEDYQAGMYVSTAKFGRQLLKNINETKSFMLSREWAIADDVTKVNVIRSIGEVITVMSAIILANAAISMAKNAKQRKDEETAGVMWNFMAYQALRLEAEFRFYTSPMEAMKILRSPAASMSMVEGLAKLASQLTGPGWQEYQQGPFKGDLKLKKTLIDLTVGVKQYYRARELGEQVGLMKSNVIRTQ